MLTQDLSSLIHDIYFSISSKADPVLLLTILFSGPMVVLDALRLLGVLMEIGKNLA